MILGWAINSAMILVAATTFFQAGVAVDALEQAQVMLEPLLGGHAAIVFAVALLFAGFSSSITAGMAGGSIFAGVFGEAYDTASNQTRAGILLTLIAALIVIFFVSDPFQGLIYSQMLLSIQLPWTIFLQIYLTSSKKVMGDYANRPTTKWLLLLVGAIVSALNIMLLFSYL